MGLSIGGTFAKSRDCNDVDANDDDDDGNDDEDGNGLHMATTHRQHPPTLSRGYILCQLIRTTFIIHIGTKGFFSVYFAIFFAVFFALRKKYRIYLHFMPTDSHHLHHHCQQ